MTDVADKGDAFVAVPDQVLRGVPRAGAVLDQHRVGPDALGRPVKRDDRKAGLLLRLQVGVVPTGGDQQQPVDLALREQPDVGVLRLEIRVGVAEDQGVAAFPGHALDRLGADRHERVRDVGDYQPDRAGALPLEAAGQFVGPVTQPLHHLRHPDRHLRVHGGLAVHDARDRLDRDPRLAGNVP